MPRGVGKNTTPGRVLVSFVARHSQAIAVAFVLLVLLSTQGAAADPGTVEPASTGMTTVGP